MRTGVGLRVARWRDIAGMTQQQLADTVAAILGRSCSHAYISLIESGKRPVAKRDLLFALARALRVSVNDLTGQPYPPSTRIDLDSFMLAAAVRGALHDPEDFETVTLRPLVTLRAEVDQAMAARMACDYVAMGRHLPGALTELRMKWELGEHDADEVGTLLVQAAMTASLALKPAGWPDLAMELARLADTVASQLDDPVSAAAAAYTRAQCELAFGYSKTSLRLAAQAADRCEIAETDTGEQANALRAMTTMLRLHAALSAATLHQGGVAVDHLAAAHELSTRVQGDPWRMEAHPANVATWAVGIALENGEPEQAPALARQVDVSELRTPQRRSRLWLDTGRALYVVGDHDAAVRALLAADDAAPGDLRHRGTAVEVVSGMVMAAPVRGGSSALRTLATRVGIDPLAPPVPA